MVQVTLLFFEAGDECGDSLMYIDLVLIGFFLLRFWRRVGVTVLSRKSARVWNSLREDSQGV
jgi:hypothetical protein